MGAPFSDTAAAVTGVYPSGPVLPENVLRFYLHFSVPMAPGRAGDFVKLVDERGRVDSAAFMFFTQELWNEDRTRLTMLIDPGRIKRSIASDRGLEPALIEGCRHTLAVDAGWPAADGSSTLPAFAKSFHVGSALRERPRVEQWSCTEPQPGGRDPLVITFDRPFDRHLLADAIAIISGDEGDDTVGGEGRPVDGTSAVGRDELSWSFTPTAPWPSGPLHVRVDDRLEDVAGNSLRALVERELPRPTRPNPPTPVPRRGDPAHV